eukprot:4959336-Ditylum_brightwellii.AAC.1
MVPNNVNTGRTTTDPGSIVRPSFVGNAAMMPTLTNLSGGGGVSSLPRPSFFTGVNATGTAMPSSSFPRPSLVG